MAERQLNELPILRFVTCVKEELLSIQLMRMNYVPKHSRDHTDSQYVSYVGIDRMGAEFIGNKQTHKQTYRHSTLYIREGVLTDR